MIFAVVFAASSLANEFRPFVLEVAPGSSSAAVKKSLGAPSAVLGQDVWVYLNFAKANPNAANPAFDTLVIAFTDGKVTAVKITDGRVVRQLLAQQTAQAAKASVAAK
jgi:hypothetical protein